MATVKTRQRNISPQYSDTRDPKFNSEHAVFIAKGNASPPISQPRTQQKTVSVLRTYVKISKSAGVNVLCVIILVAYVVVGAFTFLHFEQHFDVVQRRNRSLAKTDCIQRVLAVELPRMKQHHVISLARRITNVCVVEKLESRQQWTFVNSALYAFGIVTTLGYGKIEPFTANGRIFSVIYGLFGVPITMIIFSNFGRFIEYFVLFVYYKYFKHGKVHDNYNNSLSASVLIAIILIYLLIGALLMPLLNGHFDFFNGAYWSFLCFTAIEYGELIPVNSTLLPIAVGYICLGLAISTIALERFSILSDMGTYGFSFDNLQTSPGMCKSFSTVLAMKINGKLLGTEFRLKLRELMTAIGQNVGLEESIMHNIDLETIVKSAILVKQGKLNRVPQTMVFMEGIWPPELVPLFMKDGAFPEYADEDKTSGTRDFSFARHSRTPPHSKNQSRDWYEPTNDEDLRTIEETDEGLDTETTQIT